MPRTLAAVPTSPVTDNPEVRFGGTASFQNWRSTITAYGDLLDMDDEAEAYVAGTEARIEELRTARGDLIAATTATEAKSTPDYMAINALASAGESGVLGSILLAELGFASPPRQAALTPDVSARSMRTARCGRPSAWSGGAASSWSGTTGSTAARPRPGSSSTTSAPPSTSWRRGGRHDRRGGGHGRGPGGPRRAVAAT